MGQVPAKFFNAPAPYGSSVAANTLSPVSPAAVNPQAPLLPPNFTDPGKAPAASAAKPTPMQPTRPTLGQLATQGIGPMGKFFQ